MASRSREPSALIKYRCRPAQTPQHLPATRGMAEELSAAGALRFERSVSKTSLRKLAPRGAASHGRKPACQRRGAAAPTSRCLIFADYAFPVAAPGGAGPGDTHVLWQISARRNKAQTSRKGTFGSSGPTKRSQTAWEGGIRGYGPPMECADRCETTNFSPCGRVMESC